MRRAFGSLGDAQMTMRIDRLDGLSAAVIAKESAELVKVARMFYTLNDGSDPDS